VAGGRVSATIVINAPAAAIFAILADPAKHAGIDGTGWVGKALDSEPLTAAGQIFRMSMHHPGHPDGDYQMANRVQVFDPPNSISWAPGNESSDGTLSFPGWIWRYDLTPEGPRRTTVTLSYDWSTVSNPIRTHVGLPPFPPEHLSNSLAHLAELVAACEPFTETA
jgi:uncharacterized protein YndB with AHSA1/START domain